MQPNTIRSNTYFKSVVFRAKLKTFVFAVIVEPFYKAHFNGNFHYANKRFRTGFSHNIFPVRFHGSNTQMQFLCYFSRGVFLYNNKKNFFFAFG